MVNEWRKKDAWMSKEERCARKQRALFHIKDILIPLADKLAQKKVIFWQERVFANPEHGKVPADGIAGTLRCVVSDIEEYFDKEQWLPAMEDGFFEVLENRHERLAVLSYHIDRSVYEKSHEWNFGSNEKGRLYFDKDWDGSELCLDTLAILIDEIEDNLDDIYSRQREEEEAEERCEE